VSTAARPLFWHRYGPGALIAMAGEVDYKITRIREGAYTLEWRSTQPGSEWVTRSVHLPRQRDAKTHARLDYAERVGVQK
jgi:hypothetical protein